MANNRVELANGTVLIDLTDTTAVAEDVAAGKYFYGANGVKTQGTATHDTGVVLTGEIDVKGGKILHINGPSTETVAVDLNGGDIENISATVLLDISDDTVTTESLLSGYTAHDSMGRAIVGQAVPSTDNISGVYVTDPETGEKLIDFELPSGTLNITANGQYDVAEYAGVNVAVPTSGGGSTLGTKTITANGTYDATDDSLDGYSSVAVNVPSSAPNLQTKSATPSTSAQTITPDSGYDGLSSVSISAIQTQTKSATPSETAQTITPDSGKYLTSVSVGAISKTYVGSEVARKSSTDLTVSGATVSVPVGYYAEAASKAIASGSASTPATTITANPTISISATGLITATASASESVTPSVSAGYISSGTAGTISVSGSKTQQLTTQAAKTVTPTETEQTAVASGVYTTGVVKVGAISSTYVGSGITQRDGDDLSASGATVTVPAGYYSAQQTKSVASGFAGTPTATKGTVSNHSVTVTPSVTNTAGYISGGTKNGTAVTVSASELVSGSTTISSNGTTDVTNLASVTVAVPVVTYYTGSSDPASSLGSDGDIYLKTGA